MNQRRLGVMLSYASMAVSVVVAFLLTPLLVETLGKGQYGLFSLTTTIVAYFLLIDIGLNDTVLRFLIRYSRSEDPRELATFTGAALVGYGFLGTVMLVIGAFVYGTLTPEAWPRLTPSELEDLRFLYLAGLASAVMIIVTNPFGAMLAANERFIVIQMIGITTTIASFVLVALYLTYGESVRIVFLLNTGIQASVSLFQMGYVLFRLRPPIRFALVSFSYIKEKLFYAAPILIVVIVEMIYWRLDAILLASMMGTVAVATFAIGTLFHKHMLRLASAVSKVMIPGLIRRLEAGADGPAITGLVARIARLQAIIVLPIVAGLIFFGRDFLDLWLGPEFRDAWPVMLLTLIPFAIEAVGNVRNAVLQVKGLYWRRAGVIIVFAIGKAIATVLLIPVWGLNGAALSTGVGLLLGYAYVLWLMTHTVGFQPVRFYALLSNGLTLAAAALTVLGFALMLWPTTSWVDFVAKGGIFVAVYAAMLWLIGMNVEERASVTGLLRDVGLVRS